MISKIVANEQQQTKQLLNELLTDIKLPSTGPANFQEWLEFVSSFIKKELVASKQAAAAAVAEAASHNSLNHHQNSTDDSESNNSGGDSSSSRVSPTNSTLNGNGNSTGDAISSVTNSEVLLLQNAQLQKSLDEYKNIVADTVSDI